MPAIAKVFTTGRREAVRVPKDYRFDCNEVAVERDADKLVLTPKRRAQPDASGADDCRNAPVLDDQMVIPKDCRVPSGTSNAEASVARQQRLYCCRDARSPEGHAAHRERVVESRYGHQQHHAGSA
ncbi:MAG: hypothetical protein NTW01_09990 [Gammaproteobacteria bacterium]|nr:hypothetical protein [Gammaproteobacteria bacterium]